MGDKDIIEKKLEDYNDVFADIVNVLLFKRNYINPELLADGPTQSIYKAENLLLRQQHRDTLKYYQNAGIVIADIGIENQSDTDADMPIRIMGYDYAAYRKQIDKGSRRYPVITIVLNFSNKCWDKAKSIKELLDIPTGMEEQVHNYEITVFDIAFLEDNVINQFKSTFKHVAHFFKNRRQLKKYVPLNEEIEHLDAFLDLLKVFTGDKKYAEIKNELVKNQKKGEVVTMCEVLDYYINKGLQEGKTQIIVTMHENGCSVEEISRLTSIPIETVNEMLENASVMV